MLFPKSLCDTQLHCPHYLRCWFVTRHPKDRHKAVLRPALLFHLYSSELYSSPLVWWFGFWGFFSSFHGIWTGASLLRDFRWFKFPKVLFCFRSNSSCVIFPSQLQTKVILVNVNKQESLVLETGKEQTLFPGHIEAPCNGWLSLITALMGRYQMGVSLACTTQC